MVSSSKQFRALTLWRYPIGLLTIAATIVLSTSVAHADVVSFLIDPTTIDNNPNDGFITGSELMPIGSGGTVFVMAPTNNLTGTNRFLLDAATGLKFGGGGGSTLSFDFSPNHNILLDSYTITDNFALLGDPIFDIRDGTAVLSMSNTAASGTGTNGFAGGPIALSAGTTYSFVATDTSAATQSFLGSMNYSVTSVPEPSSCALIAIAGTVVLFRKRTKTLQ